MTACRSRWWRVHPGCFELFVHEPIRAVTDLKGKRVGVRCAGGPTQLYVSIMAAHVGVDPEQDIEWVTTDDVPDRWSCSS